MDTTYRNKTFLMKLHIKKHEEYFIYYYESWFYIFKAQMEEVGKG